MDLPDLNSPPTEEELDQLEAFLLFTCVPEGGLNIEGADGLMCAAAIGPEMLMPSKWLSLILGETAFESEEHATIITGILFRRWGEILQQVRGNPPSQGR